MQFLQACCYTNHDKCKAPLPGTSTAPCRYVNPSFSKNGSGAGDALLLYSGHRFDRRGIFSRCLLRLLLHVLLLHLSVITKIYARVLTNEEVQTFHLPMVGRLEHNAVLSAVLIAPGEALHEHASPVKGREEATSRLSDLA
jgi:hypothetical protein